MSEYADYNYVQRCLRQIEEMLQWGNSAEWHHDVFVVLSGKIQQKTHVLLSVTTLKRVWGKVNHRHAPSISTLNALALFAGYSNWHDFKLKNKENQVRNKKRNSISTQGLVIVSAIVLAIVFISLFSLIGTEGITQVDYSRVKFTSRPVAEGVPNSVVFDMDLQEIESDSIYIQQFWDPTKTVRIAPGQKQATGIYYFPGYFRAKLIVDGESIREHDLFIKAPDWLATVDYEPVPEFVENVKEKNLRLPVRLIDQILMEDEALVSTYHLVDDFKDISGDNFILYTTIRNVLNEKWAVCQSSNIVILGKSGAMIIPFSISGCVSDLGLMLNDKFYNGKEHDLSAFGVDLSQETKIRISVMDRNVNVMVNDKEIFSGRYEEPVGDFVGLRFRFLGAGEVSQAVIEDKNGNHTNLL